ncbi:MULTISPECIES: radical SAM family heme chaperone HemW [unclassified Agarivorans]|uniref:radical SAM family heme chaperone HemW n=1 Tax=unclassified Agarivorans TaxID=2636026 RepID=UPI0026E2FDD5|nr:MULTISPECIES: radical SAM family heme chaperone HemW [unclassified Agarivorans]MDO6685150.1 radical SAM family heme chaperone HemW [Agarivorans sp. 3_MG-2023]MDO6715678.1 radical SAM family heme chaperone HemW [Agarivorans sp. 2_MG-2023]
MLSPALSLYVHVPWCVQKCPYCDFNSHGLKQNLPEKEYIQALLADLDQDLQRFPAMQGRELHSIFIGGGTPSLLSAQAISDLLNGVKQRLVLSPNTEVTMEANPGTAEADRFAGYFQAGVNRLSIGVQSFQQQHLDKLGRIHNGDEAIRAFEFAQQAGFKRINLDLMHGLPNQTLEQAMQDLQQAFALGPSHLSWYQLTIEANTAFASRPPKLPNEDLLWDIYEQGHQQLQQAGFNQYEVSAYCRDDDRSQHNLNYWRFGDYLGIGCGAHGKLSDLTGQRLLRTEKVKHPKGYLEHDRDFLFKQWAVEPGDLAFEYFLNRLRLFEDIPKAEFENLTGLGLDTLESSLSDAKQQSLLEENEHYWIVTKKGRLFLNDLLNCFTD